MSKSLINQLKKKGYKTICKVSDTEVAATKKTIGRVTRDTIMDVFTLSSKENVDGLEYWNPEAPLTLLRLYSLKDF